MNRKPFALLLALSCALLSSCGEKKGEDNPSDGPTEIAGAYLEQYGSSDYAIVLPDSPQSKESLAAGEFNTFFKQATGVELPVLKDSEVTSGQKYISLGDTKQFQETLPEIDLNSFKGEQSTYVISTHSENLYIASGFSFEGAGTLYGVYDLLEDTVGYRYYSDTEIHVDSKQEVPLLNYGTRTVRPSFDARTISAYYVFTHETHSTRLRTINNSLGKEWDHLSYGHGQLEKFVSPHDVGSDGKTYGETHPDWFVSTTAEDGKNALCWTAGDELVDLCAQKMEQFLSESTEATYFMFAQQDNAVVCNCERCQKALKEWGGTPSGLQIDFTNRLIEKCEKWISENQPGREVLYLTFAYYGTESAPVKQDENGNLVPYSDRVIPHEKQRIFLAPIQSNYAYSFASPINQNFREALAGWKVVAGRKIIMYLYDLNARYYFVNFNNFSTVASMYRDCQDAGASYMLTQGISDTNATCFDEMRSFVEANLMWDTSLNYDDLVREFMGAYYDEASDAMYGYYNMIRERLAYYQAVVSPGSGTIMGDDVNRECYTSSFVRAMDEKLEEARQAILPKKESDPARYQTLYDRIQKEYLSNIYLKMSYYSDSYSNEQIKEMKSVWDYYTSYYAITAGMEGGAMPDLFGK